MNVLKTTTLLAWIILGPLVAHAFDTNAVVTAVRAVVTEQERDWNRGDLEKFMRGYLRSDQTRFASGGNVTRGWQAVFDRYQRTYGDKSTMGALTFSELEITAISPDSALAFGRWQLKREKDELSGLFSLLFRQTPEGWRIVHDHTSSSEKK